MRARFAAALLVAAASSLGVMTPLVARAAPPAPPAPPAAAAAPASVSLTIDTLAPQSPWKMRIENTGAVPLRVLADARLLSFDITPPGAKKSVRCALPADMRPSSDLDRVLVVPPKRSYSEIFDPRLYCFGHTEAAALISGAKVVAHLGFAAAAHGKKPVAPFEVAPIEGVVPVVSPAREVVSSPMTLPASESSASPAAPPPPNVATANGDAPFPTKLSLSVPAHVGAYRPYELTIAVTVHNDGARAVTLLFRPETIGFDVIAPSGTVRCSWPTRVGGTVREAYTTVRAKGRATVSVLLPDLCPDNTFDQGGLYVVRPRVDTRGGASESLGLTTFEGEVIGTTTTLLRIRHGNNPPKAQRPALD
jgi:hypothetical protein